MSIAGKREPLLRPEIDGEMTRAGALQATDRRKPRSFGSTSTERSPIKPPLAPSYGLLDMTVYGRQENWGDSPAGWPQPFATSGEQFRTNGRPTAQWSRVERPQR
jgi:Bacterial protein of unknown function (DUF899)